MTYDLMKHHFEYKHYPGVDYTIPPNSDDKQYQQSCIDLVRDLDETLRSFEIKLGAAYARLRIERGASGSSAVEQMEKILPVDVREKEDMAVDMPKTLRINQLKTTKNEIINHLRQSGFKVAVRNERDPFGTQSSQSDSFIRFDSDFDDLLIIPQEHFATLKASPLVNDGYLIFQDKASMYCPRQLSAAESEPELHIIDARSGCGTKIPQLSIIAGKKGHIFAFENRSSRLETLKLHLNSFGCKNVTIVEEDFSMCDTNDPRFEKVSTIIVEPVNSGTTIVDKLGFMLQEEEYPVDSLSQKDLYSLKRRQVAMLKHAFKFPNVKNILYMTRSTHSEENEQVVQETLDRYGVEWKLECVLPDIPSDRREDDIDECLTINPSDQTGNGIFVANFKLKPPPPEKTINELQHIEVQQSQLTINDLDRKEDFKSVTRRKRKSIIRKKGEPLKVFLPKQLRESVTRLSVPRISVLPEAKDIKLHQQAQFKHESSSKHLPLTKYPSSLAEEFDTSNTAENEDSIPKADITVFGVSLENFNKPRSVAIEVMKAKQVPLKSNKWIYPVNTLSLTLGSKSK
ncbi:hypothetical protein HDV02_001170 [Globomyces sp. JEL0801]|nr:hypothetical protein HDV02_001170 [Globomyces sp. JEL0801]